MMNRRQTCYKTILILAILTALLALAACQSEEQLDDAAATVEAVESSEEAEAPTLEPTQVAPTLAPTAIPATPEPTPEPVSEEESGTSSFTSSDGSLSFGYPQGWSVADTGPGRVILANSDEVVAGSDEGTLQSGDVRINITLVPANMLADYGLHMGNTAEEALQFIPGSELFAVEREDTQVGEIQGLELENSANAAQMSIATSDLEGALITAMHSDQVVAFVSVVTPIGEYANFEESVHQLVDSITVSVTADEMITLILSSVQQ